MPGNDLNFNKVIQDQPVVIHLSGHAEQDQSNTQNDYFFLEDEFGNAIKLDANELDSKLSCAMLHQPELVFLAACHSEKIGQIFLKNEAKHVICVNRKNQLKDEVAIQFIKAFYEYFFSCRQPVCNAFKLASSYLNNQVKIQRDQKDIFQILVRNKNDHSCFPINLTEGSPICISDMPKFQAIPARVENFIGRHRDIYEIIKLIRTNHLVTILGPPGIGKTAVVKEICTYLIHRSERNFLKDGIIYVSCVGIDYTETLIAKIAMIMRIIDTENCSPDSKAQRQWQKTTEQKIVHHLVKRNILFVLDNVEDIVVKQKENFHEFLREILQNTEQIHFVMTSRCALGYTKDITEKHYTIKKFDEYEAAKFFEKKMPKQISDEEIIELLGEDFIPIKHAKGTSQYNTDMSRQFRKHQFMKILSGHPQSIALVASLLQERRLINVYDLLKHSLDITKNLNQINEKSVGTDFSFIASMYLSVDTLKFHNKQAVELFTIFGLLPSGATIQTLSEIWTEQYHERIESILQQLIASSLVEEKISYANLKEKWYQTQVLIQMFASSILTYENKQIFHDRACLHFEKLCEQAFYVVCTSDQKESVNLMQVHDANIIECIKRCKLKDNLNVNTDQKVQENETHDKKMTQQAQKSIQKLNSFIKKTEQLQENSNKLMNQDNEFDELANDDLAILEICKSKSIQVQNQPLEQNSIQFSGYELQFQKNESTDANQRFQKTIQQKQQQELHSNENQEITGGNLAMNDLEMQNLNINKQQTLVKPMITYAKTQTDQYEVPIINNSELIVEPTIPQIKEQISEEVETDLKLEEEQEIQVKSNLTSETDKISNEGNQKISQLHIQFSEISNQSESSGQNQNQRPQSPFGTYQDPIVNSEEFKEQDKHLKSQIQQMTEHIVSKEEPSKQQDEQFLWKNYQYAKKVSSVSKRIEMSTQGALIVYYVYILTMQERAQQAIEIIKIGKEVTHSLKDQLAEANLYKLEAYIVYFKDNNSPRAMDLLRTSNEIYNSISCQLGHAICIGFQGWIQQKEEDLDNAQALFESALKAYQKLDHKFAISEIHSQLNKIFKKFKMEQKQQFHANSMKKTCQCMKMNMYTYEYGQNYKMVYREYLNKCQSLFLEIPTYSDQEIKYKVQYSKAIFQRPKTSSQNQKRQEIQPANIQIRRSSNFNQKQEQSKQSNQQQITNKKCTQIQQNSNIGKIVSSQQIEDPINRISLDSRQFKKSQQLIKTQQANLQNKPSNIFDRDGINSLNLEELSGSGENLIEEVQKQKKQEEQKHLQVRIGKTHEPKSATIQQGQSKSSFKKSNTKMSALNQSHNQGKQKKEVKEIIKSPVKKENNKEL